MTLKRGCYESSATYRCLHLLIRFLVKSPRRGDPGFSQDNVTALQGQLQQLFHLHDSGVEQAFIDTLPLFLYKAVKGVKESSDCAVCLCEFQGEDTLRLLPKCSHAFHAECIDTWLLSHSTCPLCRASLLPDRNNPSSPHVFVVIPSDEESRELATDTEELESEEGSRNLSGSGQNDRHISNSPPKTMNDYLQKPDNAVPVDKGVVGKMMPIKLGKFRNVDGQGEANMASSSSSNIDPKRCYSMGSYEYVLDSSNLQVFIAPTPYRKQSSTRNLPLTPGHRPNLSECILPEEVERSIQMTPHMDFVCESKIIKAIHSLRPKKDDTTADNTAVNSGLQRHEPADVKSRESELSASVGSSKRWVRPKRIQSGSMEMSGSSRRAVSFRLPLPVDAKFKQSTSRRTLSETEVLSWEENEQLPGPNPKSWDLGPNVPASNDNSSTTSNEAAENSVSSFAKRTLNWLVGRQKRVVHASLGRNQSQEGPMSS
ncbi:hypothetical protein SUGI_0568750 [Cryptomeria japonica]|nr:hypothetical protein SUGI_0568750 [Cryptomeria japonica]